MRSDSEDRVTPELAAEERESADRVAMIGQIPSAQRQSIPGVGAARRILSRGFYGPDYERQLRRDCKSRATVNGDGCVLRGILAPVRPCCRSSPAT